MKVTLIAKVLTYTFAFGKKGKDGIERGIVDDSKMEITHRSQHIRVTVLVLLIVSLQLTLLPPSTVFSGDDSHEVWLPLILNDNTNTNPIQQGIATYYGATGAGACSFAPSPDDLLVAAMNAEEYNNAAACGAYIEVTGPQGTVTVRIVDLCPECKAGHLDLSQEAFGQIAELAQGRVTITWQVVSPPLTTPIAYHFKAGSNQWWTAVQVRNHRNPIAKLEYLANANQWVDVSRTAYNYFVQTNPGMGTGPFTFRVTDSYGNELIDTGIPHIEDGTRSGTSQFPSGPSGKTLND